jgi:hypothetical protein
MLYVGTGYVDFLRIVMSERLHCFPPLADFLKEVNILFLTF